MNIFQIKVRQPRPLVTDSSQLIAGRLYKIEELNCDMSNWMYIWKVGDILEYQPTGYYQPQIRHSDKAADWLPPKDIERFNMKLSLVE